MGLVNMFLVLRCGRNCSILVWPPQRPCDLHLTKTKIYLPKLPSMLNLKSIRPLGAVLQHRLSKEPDFAIPLFISIVCNTLYHTIIIVTSIFHSGTAFIISYHKLHNKTWMGPLKWILIMSNGTISQGI